MANDAMTKGEAPRRTSLAMACGGYLLLLIAGLTIFRVSLLFSAGLLLAGGFLVYFPQAPTPLPKISWRERLILVGGLVVLLCCLSFVDWETARHWPVLPVGFVLSWPVLFHGYRDLFRRSRMRVDLAA